MSCNGECCVCYFGSDCIAGHGDDFYAEATKNQIIKRLDEGKFPNYTDYMKKYLKSVYDYDYDKNLNNPNRLDVETKIEQKCCCNN